MPYIWNIHIMETDEKKKKRNSEHRQDQKSNKLENKQKHRGNHL